MNTEQYSEMENKQLITNGRLDLIVLVNLILLKKWIVLYTVLVFIILGLLISFLSPTKYTASAIILPQTESQNNLGSMGALASMAGVNISAMLGTEERVSSDIYPSIVQSYPFLDELMNCPFTFSDGTMTLYEYYEADSAKTAGNFLLKYTIRLPWTLKKMFFKEPSIEVPKEFSGENNENIRFVNSFSREVMQEVLMAISLNQNEENGLIELRGTAKEPIVAAQMTQKVMEMLQSKIISYKTIRQRDNLEFIKKGLVEKKHEFETAQKALYEYRDANRNRVTERSDFRNQELSDAYNLAQSIYHSLAQEKEQAEIAVQRETPVFTIIEPVVVPIKRSAPVRTKIMIIHVFLGSFVGFVIVLVQILWSHIREIWSN